MACAGAPFFRVIVSSDFSHLLPPSAASSSVVRACDQSLLNNEDFFGGLHMAPSSSGGSPDVVRTAPRKMNSGFSGTVLSRRRTLGSNPFLSFAPVMARSALFLYVWTPGNIVEGRVRTQLDLVGSREKYFAEGKSFRCVRWPLRSIRFLPS